MLGNVSVIGVFNRVLRQMSEQYFTSSQFFAHRFRQVIGRPQAAQGFEGRQRLLPLNDGVSRVMSRCMDVRPSAVACAGARVENAGETTRSG